MAKGKGPLWKTRLKTLSRYVDIADYPGAKQGQPTKYAKDKIREHHRAIARYLKENPDVRVYKPRSKARAAAIQAAAAPKDRRVLPGIKSLKVAFIRDDGPGEIRNVRIRHGRLAYDRVERTGARYRQETFDLSLRQKLALTDHPEQFLARARFAKGVGPRDMVRILTINGGVVGSRGLWRMEMPLEDLPGAIAELVEKYGATQFGVFVAGFQVVSQ